MMDCYQKNTSLRCHLDFILLADVLNVVRGGVYVADVRRYVLRFASAATIITEIIRLK